MKKMSTYLLILLVILLFSSCAVSESISLGKNGSASSTDITVYPFFIDVLNDFSEFLPKSDESIMDAAITGFANNLEASGKAFDVHLVKNAENSYSISFAFNDIPSVLSALKGDNEISVLKEDGSSLKFYLDINNYHELKAIIPFLADPNFEVYGPEYNQGMSQEDYLDMIYYLLGEDGPDAIRNSTIDITITTPSEIVSSSGVVQKGPTTVLYSFPLIDFLLLDEPMGFEITWK